MPDTVAYVGDVHHDEQIQMVPNLVKLTVRDIRKWAGHYNMVCIREFQSAVESCVNIA